MSEITHLMWIDWGHTQGLHKTCTNSQQGMIFWILHVAMLRILTFLLNRLLWLSNQNSWGNVCWGPDCSSTSSVYCFRLSIHLLAVQCQHLSLLPLRLLVSGWFKFSKAFQFTLANLKPSWNHILFEVSCLHGMWCDLWAPYTQNQQCYFLSNSPDPSYQTCSLCFNQCVFHF